MIIIVVQYYFHLVLRIFTLQVTNESKIWKYYGQLTNHSTEDNPETQQKVSCFLNRDIHCSLLGSTCFINISLYLCLVPW
jgi:hypothetical protein